MKTFLAAALILALGIAGVSLWGGVHAQRTAASSSQIFIHGTPVCVTQAGGEIHAAVGMCGATGDSAPPRGTGKGLPPGHPPVGPGSEPSGAEGRRVLI